MFAACSTGSPASDESSDPGGGFSSEPIRRDIAALERLRSTPQACDADRGCPTGSHCDDDSHTCQWECLADSDCGRNKACDARGTCVIHFAPLIANNTTACQALDPAERRAALLGGNGEPALNDQHVGCFTGTDDTTDSCPCGSYCSIDAECHVDCLADSPPPGYEPGAGMECSPSGRRRPSGSHTDGPPLQVSLEIAPLAVTANTVLAPVLVPVTVKVDVNSLDFLQATHPAKVRYHVTAINATDPVPLVKCASGAALAASCDLDGGWTFSLTNPTLRSAPRTIWVQVPKTATAKDWTLVANSESAGSPATAAVHARPVAVPATDPGHYTGTIAWPNAGAAPGTPALAVPIEAILTPTYIALIEPSHVVFPANVVLARDPLKHTFVGWLDTTNSGAVATRYDVRLDLGAFTYNATTGHVAGAFSLVTGPDTTGTPFTLALDRTGDANAPACTTSATCASGSYCDIAMKQCLPGEPSGGGVLNGSGSPSQLLASAQVHAWSPAVTALAANNPALLGGTGLPGIGAAYCYQPGETIAAKFGMSRALRDPSFDLGCVQGVQQPPAEYDQTTFAFANRTTEVEQDSHGAETFNLLDACLADLNIQPGTSFTPASLLPARSCASLARFYLALNANTVSGAGQVADVPQMRMVTQLLRQWLGVTAYVANTTIQGKQYDDALGDSSVPAETRLGGVVDVVDRGLRVLLDPAVRPQFAAGAPEPIVAVSPDYRIAQRPVARWTFNSGASQLFPAADGPVPFNIALLDTSAKGVLSNDPNVTGVTATCSSTQPIAIDNNRFTIVVYVRNVIGGGAFTLFSKAAPDGQQIWIEATPVSTSQLSLSLKDSQGGVATFPAISGAGGNWGLLGFSANNGTYRLTQAQPGATTVFGASSVLNGGPRWGTAGTVQLGCNLATTCQNGSCTSWDYNTAGDGLDVQYFSSTQTAWTRIRTCTTGGVPRRTTCSGPIGTQDQCNTAAATLNVQVLAQRWPNPPASLLPMTVVGTLTSQTTTEDNDGSIASTTTYRCSLAVTNQAVAGTRVKPVCGCAGNSTTWVPQGLFYDELSLWSRALEPEEISAMAATFNFNPANESLPPADQVLPGTEQATSLAVHISEAAGADLKLLASYLEAERGVSYGECYLGGPSPARDRARGRAGKNLRLVAVLEAEAARLASAPGATSAPWYARYQASRTVLASYRAKALQSLQRLDECKNPLEIPEEELPLFVGQTVGAAERFFASTRYLVGLANTEITLASTALGAAQTAYNAQVTADFTRHLATTDQQNAIAKLKVSYDGVLRRYCGAPAGDGRLIDGFMGGSINASNCFIKTERPECQNLSSTTIADVSPTCLRGEIGERLMAIKSAYLDVTAARASLDRATEQFHADTLYCALRQIDLGGNTLLLQRHQEHLRTLRQEQDDDNDIAFGIGAIANLFAQNYGGAIADIQADSNLDTNFHIQQEQDAYQLEVNARSADLDIKECFHKADNDEFAVRAANDVIVHAQQAVRAAVFGLDDATATLAALASEAQGQVNLETTVDRTPPHLHYWLDNNIDSYNRHLAFARRLTYLAVRAYEYEAGESTGLRGTVLTARRPDNLQAVTAFLGGKSEPFGGGQFVFGEHAPVVSLRDEVLHIENLVGNLHLSPGDPAPTPTTILRRYLTSDASKIYGANHQYLGRGIRFSLRPDSWLTNTCQERISRIVPLVSHDLAATPNHPELLLIQNNAFGSQKCVPAPGVVSVTRVGATTSLVTDDASAAFGPLATATSMLVSLAPSTVVSRTDLANMPYGALSGFAGRGLYADYTLVFPANPTACTPQGCSGWSDDAVAQINDVLLRFEIVDGTRQVGQSSVHQLSSQVE